MDYIEICENDYSAFHELANAYYREGEDDRSLVVIKDITNFKNLLKNLEYSKKK